MTLAKKSVLETDNNNLDYGCALCADEASEDEVTVQLEYVALSGTNSPQKALKGAKVLKLAYI